MDELHSEDSAVGVACIVIPDAAAESKYMTCILIIALWLYAAGLGSPTDPFVIRSGAVLAVS
ncbi:hypothetical protein THIOKS11330003 [Thiocapsa sp. KS1]|nr:hypothetical protein THIOKS11330003 [Thiocapsa sp. KS1]